MPNYAYTVDSHFQPFSMQELLTPFVAYKEAYEKDKEAYEELNNADTFQYLSETLPEDSKARHIYDGYANTLKEKAEDFAKNGLTRSNRIALSSLKKRYKGEIGRLMKADEAMKEEQKFRRSLNAQDSSRLYANNNPTIDDYLDGKTPNLYSISGNELYTKGAEIGKAISARVVNIGEGNMTLGGYYRDMVSKYGYSQELLNQFRKDMNAIPELKEAYEGYMKATGVNENLKGYDKDRAHQYFINGMLNGAVYQETHNPQRDLGVLTAAEQKADDRARQQLELTKRGQDISLALSGHTYDSDTNTISYDPTKDPSLQKAKAVAEIKAKAKASANANKKGVAYDSRNKNTTMIGAKTGIKYKSADDNDNVIGTPIEDLSGARALSSQEYSQLVDANGNITNENLKSAIGNGNLSDYEIYVLPKGSDVIHHWWRPNDVLDEDIYIAIPRESKRAATTGAISTPEGSSSVDTNDIPE